jgi:hypothetical protein
MDRGRAVLSLCVMGVTAWMVITAIKWPFRTAVFPIIVGIPVFLMATVELCLVLCVRKEHGKDSTDTSEVYFRLEGEDRGLSMRRFIFAFTWIIGLFLLVLFVGFPIAVPLFVLLHLRIHGREGWKISLGLTIAAWIFFYGLFVWLLHIPFGEGWAQRGLTALGIL